MLDVVTYIQRSLDPTLAYRYACRVGMCGSCAMTVNGVPRWTCRTHVDKVVRNDFVYRELGWKNFWNATRTTAYTTAVIFAIIAMAVYFSIIMTYTRTPQAIVQFFIDYNIGPITFMVLAGVAILILGTFIEAVPVFYLTMPILYPLCAVLKIDLLHFYVFVTGLIGLGLITPPVCVGVYTAAAILRTPPQQAFRYVPGFLRRWHRLRRHRHVLPGARHLAASVW